MTEHDDLPLWHRTDLGTEEAAARGVAEKAKGLRAQAYHLLVERSNWVFQPGITGDEFIAFVDPAGTMAESSCRARLSDLCMARWGAVAVKTTRTRVNRRGNDEAVYMLRKDVEPNEWKEKPT